MTVEWWIWNDFEESGSRNLIDVIARNFPGGTEESLEISIMTAGVLAEIQTKHLPNKSLGR
jgi:hypothetical protein